MKSSCPTFSTSELRPLSLASQITEYTFEALSISTSPMMLIAGKPASVPAYSVQLEELVSRAAESAYADPSIVIASRVFVATLAVDVI